VGEKLVSGWGDQSMTCRKDYIHRPHGEQQAQKEFSYGLSPLIFDELMYKRDWKGLFVVNGLWRWVGQVYNSLRTRETDGENSLMNEFIRICFLENVKSCIGKAGI